MTRRLLATFAAVDIAACVLLAALNPGAADDPGPSLPIHVGLLVVFYGIPMFAAGAGLTGLAFRLFRGLVPGRLYRMIVALVPLVIAFAALEIGLPDGPLDDAWTFVLPTVASQGVLSLVIALDLVNSSQRTRLRGVPD